MAIRYAILPQGLKRISLASRMQPRTSNATISKSLLRTSYRSHRVPAAADHVTPSAPVNYRASQLYEEQIPLAYMHQVISAIPSHLQPLALMVWVVEVRLWLLSHLVEGDQVHRKLQLKNDSAALSEEFEIVSELLEELIISGDNTGSELLHHQCPIVNGDSFSPGFAKLTAVVMASPTLPATVRQSIGKSVLQIAGVASILAGKGAGLGIEHQLNALLVALQLPATVPVHRNNLDYGRLVHHAAVQSTVADQGYNNAEDLFFRGRHIIIEAKVLLANGIIRNIPELADAGRWGTATAQMRLAAHIIDKAGDEFFSLTNMCLVDFYGLRVLIDGLSAGGSTQIMMIKKLVLRLLAPFKTAAMASVVQGTQLPHLDDATLEAYRLDHSQREVLLAVIAIYNNPTSYAALYEYARGLEALESAVLDSFFYKHYALVTSVIGSGVKKHAVPHLKHTYEHRMFALLNATRSLLALQKLDELANVKGRMKDDIIQNLESGNTVAARAAALLTKPEQVSGNQPYGSKCPFFALWGSSSADSSSP